MERPVLVYDGDCGLCTSSAELVARHLRRRPTDYDVSPAQRLDLPSLGLTEAQCREALQWVGSDGGHASGPDAVAAMLCASRRPGRALGKILQTPFVRPGAAVAYRWVARNRYRLPGGTPACEMPEPHHRGPSHHQADPQES